MFVSKDVEESDGLERLRYILSNLNLCIHTEKTNVPNIFVQTYSLFKPCCVYIQEQMEIGYKPFVTDFSVVYRLNVKGTVCQLYHHLTA